MNNSFIKILRFELRLNYMMWIYNLVIATALLTMLYFSIQGIQQHPIVSGVLFPILILLTCIFTINSYQESTKSQTMQMYHLLPVSRNIKFFSKQFITLIAFPLSLFILTVASIGIIRIFVSSPEVLVESGSNDKSLIYLLIFWIVAQSISTFFAVSFKKNKILYSILVYFCFKFLMFLIMILIFQGYFKTSGFLFLQSFDYQYQKVWLMMGLLFLSAVFYSISYRLFFRRQL
jgi:hypothetical protein